MDTSVYVENPKPIFGRLNLVHGPNTEQMVQEFSSGPTCEAEFDLGFSEINEARIESGWVELILENPGFNQITIRDLTLGRRQRAEL